jgi:hypothetical protein
MPEGCSDSALGVPANGAAAPTEPTPTARARKPARRRKSSPFKPWQRRFLKALAEFASVSLAASASKVSRQYAYEARKKDEVFAVAWEEAHEQAVDSLVEAAFIRAKRSYRSDRLAMFLLQAHRPDVYRERGELGGGINLQWDQLPLDPVELAKRLGPVAMKELLEQLQRAITQSPN